MLFSALGAALFSASALASPIESDALAEPQSGWGILPGYDDRLLRRASETCPTTSQQSCHNTTVQTNLCCFNAPGGALLQTQFWDTDPVTGPDDSWTIHGLWVRLYLLLISLMNIRKTDKQQ